MDAKLRTMIHQRSGGRCEVQVRLGGIRGRCGNKATEIHHLLTKARGGVALDRVYETYHLLHVCAECHRASDGGEAYAGGLLIHGRVIWDRMTNRPIYSGPDHYLSQKYCRPSIEWVESELL